MKQWFSKFIVHPSYLEDLLKRRRLPSTPRVSDSVLVAQSCPTLCNPMDSSLPGSSIHGIL